MYVTMTSLLCTKSCKRQNATVNCRNPMNSSWYSAARDLPPPSGQVHWKQLPPTRPSQHGKQASKEGAALLSAYFSQ